MKKLKFETKNALFDFFWGRAKNIAIFEISFLDFVEKQNLTKKQYGETWDQNSLICVFLN